MSDFPRWPTRRWRVWRPSSLSLTTRRVSMAGGCWAALSSLIAMACAGETRRLGPVHTFPSTVVGSAPSRACPACPAGQRERQGHLRADAAWIVEPGWRDRHADDPVSADCRAIACRATDAPHLETPPRPTARLPARGWKRGARTS